MVSPEDPAAAGPTLHMILKADESWRPYGDYRCLNCSQPRTCLRSGICRPASTDAVSSASWTSLCRLKTAVILPFELVDFICMLFSPKNASQTFPGLLDRVGTKLDFVFIYLDNILVASCDKQSHLLHLQTCGEVS
jgi:hypothetical protein